MAFRRRRQKLTWLPTNGTASGYVGEDPYVTAEYQGQLAIAQGVSVAHIIFPLVPPDEPIEQNFAGASLPDVVGSSEYVVKRIVGNFFATSYANVAADTTHPASLVYFGIFVARADGDDPTLPIGGLTSAPQTTHRNYSPHDNQTIREPWMFRRSWVIGNYATQGGQLVANVTLTQSGAWQRFPKTTAEYSGIRSGPHFDVKSARRIRNDERLWGIVSAAPAPLNWPNGANTDNRVEFIVDYRILGGLRRARNRSNF